MFNPRGSGQRALKSQGSCKINATCTSAIEVSEDCESGSVTVIYWKTHVEHKADPQRTILSATERTQLAGTISQGVSLDIILDNIRNNAAEDEEFKRLHLLTKHDLNNIKRNITTPNTMRLHSNDVTSVHLWVEEMKSLGEDSPVVFYKEQGNVDEENVLDLKDVMLIIMTKFQKTMIKKFGGDKICLDSTHGTNAYDFEVITLLTVDEFGSGCPVAFCISNRVDTEVLKKFFSHVKQQVGDIYCQVFMTDDFPAFMNAWCSVMSSPKHQLLCTWHIDKNWREQLPKIKGSSEKKGLVYKHLRVLLNEPNKEKFQLLLSNCVDELLKDDETRDFGMYFQRYYANRPSLWALCHRIGLGINTNMYLEAFHRTLKYVYLDGKKNKRLDKCIHALVKLSRDQIFNRLIKVLKKKPTKRISDITAAHNKAKKLDQSKISVLVENCVWEVVSEENSDNQYLVNYHDLVECACMLRCASCNICVHMFSCTCADHLIKFNICKHIHSCIMKYNITDQVQIPVDDKHEEELVSLFLVAKSQTFIAKSSKNDIELIKRKCERILGLANTVSSVSDVAAVHKNLDLAIAMLEKNIPNNNFSNKENNEPSNKNIETQRRFSSTKRKRIQQPTMQKPTTRQAAIISEGILNPDMPVLDIHSGTDHTYL